MGRLALTLAIMMFWFGAGARANTCNQQMALIYPESNAARSFLTVIKKLTGQKRIGIETIDLLMSASTPLSPRLSGVGPIEQVSYSKALGKIVKKLSPEDWDFIREKLKELSGELHEKSVVEEKNRDDTKKVILPHLVASESYPVWVRSLKSWDVNGDKSVAWDREDSPSGETVLRFYENLSWRLLGEVKVNQTEPKSEYKNLRTVPYGNGKRAVVVRTASVGHNTVYEHLQVFDIASGQRLAIVSAEGLSHRMIFYEPFEFNGKFYALVRESNPGDTIVDLQSGERHPFGWLGPNSKSVPEWVGGVPIPRRGWHYSRPFFFDGKPAFIAEIGGFYDNSHYLLLIDGLTGEVLNASKKLSDIPDEIFLNQLNNFGKPFFHLDAGGVPLAFLSYADETNKNGHPVAHVYIRNLLTGEALSDFIYHGVLGREIELHRRNGVDYGIAVTDEEILVFSPSSGIILGRAVVPKSNETRIKNYIEPVEGGLARVHLFTLVGHGKHLIFDLMKELPNNGGAP